MVVTGGYRCTTEYSGIIIFGEWLLAWTRLSSTGTEHVSYRSMPIETLVIYAVASAKVVVASGYRCAPFFNEVSPSSLTTVFLSHSARLDHTFRTHRSL